MRVKSFFTGSMAEAIALARKELGADAVLLNSRRMGEGGEQTRYEVVFGVDDAPAAAEAPAAPAAPAVPAALAPRAAAAAALSVVPALTPTQSPGAFPTELEAIRKQIDELRAALTNAPSPPPAMSAPRARIAESIDLEPWRERLAGEDCYARVISELLLAVQERLRSEPRSGPVSVDLLDGLVREELEHRIRTTDRISAGTVVLVGPPGAGKTTTLVKLAIQQGLATGRSVQIVSADPHRAVGGETLRAYASILGVSYLQVDTFGSFMEAMKQSRHKDLILVDTPGYSGAEQDLARELAGYFECFDDLECHLVLPASMKGSDLARCAEVYSVFQPSALLFTRLDETATCGTLVSLSISLQLPISYLGCGQSIPDDLQPAVRAELVERTCGPAHRVESVA